ncbi:MAG: stage V sporulation protein AD [Christensenellaceae bacterium]|nr:stage V sporulation protein AD [Christensenellaceae bacterium]
MWKENGQIKSKHRGEQSVVFENPVYVVGRGAVGGQMEKEGPLSAYFDVLAPDALWGEDTFEKAERKLFLEAAKKALENAHLGMKDMDMLLGGDLLSQIISSGFAARELNIPFLGIYGACSSMAEGLALSAMLVDGGFARRAVCAISSHFAAAERQFRYPLELGTPKPPTAQHTATAAGACVVSSRKVRPDDPTVTAATVGKVVDLGISDANNMGAAMAPAAADTILTHLEDMAVGPEYYDLIVTGDLGTFGSELLLKLAADYGVDLSRNHFDCGKVLYKGVKGVNCGASGCGCGASVLCGYLLTLMRSGKLGRILFVATGALLSPTSSLQGESIPCIAHAVSLERGSAE